MNYLKQNWPGLVAIAVGLASFAVIGGMQGCSLDEIIQVRVPAGMKDNPAARPYAGKSVTLAQARAIMSEAEARYQAQLDQLSGNIADGAYFEELAGAVIEGGLDVGVPALGTIPGGGIAAALLTGAGGLMLNKPGAKKKTKRDVKEAVRDALDRLMAENLPTSESDRRAKRDAMASEVAERVAPDS